MGNKNSRFSYTDSQKELNRALKMQDMELKDLEERSTDLSNSVSSNGEQIAQTRSDVDELMKKTELLKAKALKIAEKKGITIPENLKAPIQDEAPTPFVDNSPYLVDEKISINDIPSWEDIMEKTDEQVPEEIVLEDLLSAEEFQYCIEDIERIHNEFAAKTKLSKVDIAFLMVATALQTARWILINHFLGDLGDTSNRGKREGDLDGNKRKKQTINKFNEKSEKYSVENKHSDQNFPTWKDILFGQYERIDGKGKCDRWRCPYDAQENAPAGFDEGGRGSHRVNTLGHDPMLGWIFGTANLMTCTISLSKKFNFATYNVTYPGQRFGTRTSMLKMLSDVIESTKEDKYRLAAGLVAQYGHLKSDVFTQMGLPVPLLEAFSPETASKLYDSQYDSLCQLKDMGIVGLQSGIAILINMIIGYVHGLFYNKDKDGRREHYEVRTRKILLYSNTISTSLNLAYVGINAAAGNEGEALKKLDLGGLLVTLYRLFSDVRFITRVKEQYIKEELDKVTKDAIAELDSMFE